VEGRIAVDEQVEAHTAAMRPVNRPKDHFLLARRTVEVDVIGHGFERPCCGGNSFRSVIGLRVAARAKK